MAGEMIDRAELLNTPRGQLIVSCQAYPGDPLRSSEHMAASVARAPVADIRAEGIDDLRAIRSVTTVPPIGLWKDGDADVYITPTAQRLTIPVTAITAPAAIAERFTRVLDSDGR